MRGRVRHWEGASVSEQDHKGEIDAPGTQTGHDDGLTIVGWKFHDRRFDRHRHFISKLEIGKVSRTLSESGRPYYHQRLLLYYKG